MTRLKVLDFLRGVAILCVVLDHALVWLGADKTHSLLHNFTIFSVVPLFFLAGFTFALSFLKKPPKFFAGKINIFQLLGQYILFFWQKAKKLVLAYFIGLTLIFIWQNQGFIFADWWQTLLAFPQQFYFIIIYLELLLVAPLVVKLWQWSSQKHKSLPFFFLLVIFFLAALFTKTLILPASYWLPARQLLGGWEFFVFSAGTFLAYLYQQGTLPKNKLSWPLLFFFGLLGIILLVIFNKTELMASQPPKIWTLIYSALMLACLTGLFYLSSWSFRPLTFFGEKSLDIYIFHALFIAEIVKKTTFWQTWPLWGQLTFFSLISILGSIFLFYLINFFLYQANLGLKKAKKIRTLSS